jgi:hypothetical protein
MVVLLLNIEPHGLIILRLNARTLVLTYVRLHWYDYDINEQISGLRLMSSRCCSI